MVVGIFKDLIYEIRFRIKLKEMDNWYYFIGGNCFGIFPPSFYYTHTEEEIECITAKELERLREIKKQLE